MRTDEYYKAVAQKVRDIARETRAETAKLEKQIENFIDPSPAPKGTVRDKSQAHRDFESVTREKIDTLNKYAEKRIEKVLNTLPGDTPETITNDIRRDADDILRGFRDGIPEPTREFFQKGGVGIDFSVAAEKEQEAEVDKDQDTEPHVPDGEEEMTLDTPEQMEPGEEDEKSVPDKDDEKDSEWTRYGDPVPDEDYVTPSEYFEREEEPVIEDDVSRERYEELEQELQQERDRDLDREEPE